MVEWICEDCGSTNDSTSMRCACGYGGRVPQKGGPSQSSPFAERHTRADLDRLCGQDANYRAMMEGAAALKHLSREELVAMAKGHAAEWMQKLEKTRAH